MTKFCDGCRMEGYATGELADMKTETIGSRVGAVLIDERGNPSQPFWSDGQTPQQVITEIDICQGVCEIARAKGLFKKSITESDCPTIGPRAIKQDSEAYRTMARVAGI